MPARRVLAAHRHSGVLTRLTCGLCGASAPQCPWPKGDQVTSVRQDTALPQLMEIDLHVTPN